MYKKKLLRLHIKITCITMFFALTSMVALFMPIIPRLGEHGQNVMQITLGFVFWTGLIIGLGIFSSINKDRKIYNRRHGIEYTGFQKVPAAFRFYQNTEALIAQSALLIAALILTLNLFMRFAGNWLQMSLFCICIFTFLMHCLFNSKNYIYVKTLKAGDNYEKGKK